LPVCGGAAAFCTDGGGGLHLRLDTAVNASMSFQNVTATGNTVSTGARAVWLFFPGPVSTLLPVVLVASVCLPLCDGCLSFDMCTDDG
jgi:hypothetical protein